MKIYRLLLILTLPISVIAGCAPEVGSEEWCQDMIEKSKGDWTVNETAEYAQHCLFE